MIQQQKNDQYNLYINRLKEQKHMIISNGAVKHLIKCNYFKNTFRKLVIKRYLSTL